MALTLAWMSACDIDGLKITTFGPKSGLPALAPWCGSADAKARPPGSTAPRATANTDMPRTLQRRATRRRADEPFAPLKALPVEIIRVGLPSSLGRDRHGDHRRRAPRGHAPEPGTHGPVISRWRDRRRQHQHGFHRPQHAWWYPASRVRPPSRSGSAAEAVDHPLRTHRSRGPPRRRTNSPGARRPVADVLAIDGDARSVRAGLAGRALPARREGCSRGSRPRVGLVLRR